MVRPVRGANPSGSLPEEGDGKPRSHLNSETRKSHMKRTANLSVSEGAKTASPQHMKSRVKSRSNSKDVPQKGKRRAPGEKFSLLPKAQQGRKNKVGGAGSNLLSSRRASTHKTAESTSRPARKNDQFFTTNSVETDSFGSLATSDSAPSPSQVFDFQSQDSSKAQWSEVHNLVLEDMEKKSIPVNILAATKSSDEKDHAKASSPTNLPTGTNNTQIIDNKMPSPSTNADTINNPQRESLTSSGRVMKSMNENDHETNKSPEINIDVPIKQIISTTSGLTDNATQQVDQTSFLQRVIRGELFQSKQQILTPAQKPLCTIPENLQSSSEDKQDRSIREKKANTSAHQGGFSNLLNAAFNISNVPTDLNKKNTVENETREDEFGSARSSHNTSFRESQQGLTDPKRTRNSLSKMASTKKEIEPVEKPRSTSRRKKSKKSKKFNGGSWSSTTKSSLSSVSDYSPILNVDEINDAPTTVPMMPPRSVYVSAVGTSKESSITKDMTFDVENIDGEPSAQRSFGAYPTPSPSASKTTQTTRGVKRWFPRFDPDMEDERLIFITRLYKASRPELQLEINIRSKGIIEKYDAPRGMNLCVGQCSASLENRTWFGLRSSWNDPLLSHDLGVLLEEGEDERAHVRRVMEESSAQRAGLKVGDIVSFAVALNNVEPTDPENYMVASKLVSKLDSLGMQTSYRELFDMFLSKTTSGWPVAMVFRRKSWKAAKIQNSSLLFSSPTMEVDCHRASEFLRCMALQSRERDFCKDDGGICELVRGNIEYFLPRPTAVRKRAERLSSCAVEPPNDGLSSSTQAVVRVNQVSSCFPIASSRWSNNSLATVPRSVLTSFVEDAVGVVCIRCARVAIGAGLLSGSGIVVERLPDGLSWSAPSSLGIFGIGAGLQFGLDTSDFIILIRSKALMDRFHCNQQIILGNAAGTLAGNYSNEVCGVEPFPSLPRHPTDWSDFVAFAKCEGAFVGVSLVGTTLFARDEVNNKVYQQCDGNSDPITPNDILRGGVSAPLAAMDLYGALRTLEFPYSMHAHPVPPTILRRYIKSDWLFSTSCEPDPAEDPLPPFDDISMPMTLRNLLTALRSNPLVYMEDKREMEVFMYKFTRFLNDGIPVDLITVSNRIVNKTSHREPKTLFLAESPGEPMTEAHLQFAKRRKPAAYRTDCESEKESDVALKGMESSRSVFQIEAFVTVGNIIRITQTPLPPIIFQARKRSEFKRFILIETDSKMYSRVMFLARNEKDTALLLCGLKLLLEMSDH